MGYESRVACRIQMPKSLPVSVVETKYNEFLHELDAQSPYTLRSLFDDAYDIDDNTITLATDWHKWYDEFAEIQAFDKVLTFLEDYIDTHPDDKGGYQLMRFGENYEDFDERVYGDIDNYICFYRGFEF